MAERATPGLVALLTALIMLGQMATSIYVPSLPSLAVALQADPAKVKLTMTAFLGAFALAQLIYGPISDRVGRRPVLLVGIAIYIFGSVACAAAPSIEALIGGRILQGIGACAGAAIGRAVVRDRFAQAEAARILAFTGMVLTIGPAIGPIAGGLLQVWWGWRAGFIALTLFGVLVMVAIAVQLKESLARPDPLATSPLRLIGNYTLLLRDRQYLGYLLLVGSCFGVLFAYVTGLPFVFIEILKMSPDLFGFVFLFTVGGYFVGSLIASRCAGRIASIQMIFWGIASTVVGAGALLAFVLLDVVSSLTIMVPLMLYMAGFGLIIPNAFAAALMPFPHMAGAASAMLGCGQMAVSALASAAVAAFYDGTARPMACVTFALATLGAASYWGLIRRPR